MTRLPPNKHLRCPRHSMGASGLIRPATCFPHKLLEMAFVMSLIVALTIVGRPCQAGLFLLDFGSREGTADAWQIIDNYPDADAENIDLVDTCQYQGGDVSCAVFGLINQAGPADDDVTLELLGVEEGHLGFIPNNPVFVTEPRVYDRVEIPRSAIGDYQYRNPDTAATIAPFRFGNLNPGRYNVTVFEGRTSDGNGQFAKLWVGDVDGSNEPEEATNTDDFSSRDGAPGFHTAEFNIAEGDYLWYQHQEDNSGGISGIIIRQIPDGFTDPTDKLQRQVAGTDLGTVTLEGVMGNKVLTEPGPQAGLAQYWFEGNLSGDPEAFAFLGTEGDEVNPLLNPNGQPIATAGTWWSGSGSLQVGGQSVFSYPPELIGAKMENQSNADNYSVRMIGEIFIEENGDYLFRDGVDDLMMLAVDLDGNGELDDLDTVANADVGQAPFGDVLLLDVDPATVDGGSQPFNGFATFENIDAGGEWRQVEIWTAEGGGGDAGVLFKAKADDPDVWDDAAEDALTQAQIDKFIVQDDQLRTGEAVTLLSADLVAAPTNKGLFEFVIQVSPDGNDQIAIGESALELNKVLDVSNMTVRIQQDGELAAGAEFQIFGADMLQGMDSLELLFDDVTQWDLSRLESGIIVFGSGGGGPPGLAGDIDGDGMVGFPDFLILSANFGMAGGPAEGDIDGDGNVGFPDFLTLSANFGQSAGAAAVPEPSALALFGLAGLACGSLRRRGR